MNNEAQIRLFLEQAQQQGISPEEAMAYLRQKGVLGQEQPQPTPQPEEQKGLGRSLLEGVVEPFTKYGGMIAEPIAQAGRYLTDPVYRKALKGYDPEDELTFDEIEQISQMQENVIPEEIGGFEVGMTPEELASPGDIAKEGAKRYAGAASMLVPAGGSLKAATALGGVAGGLRAYSEDENILGGVAGGAVTGGALNIGGRVLGAGIREAREGGRAMQRTVLGPGGTKTPRFFDTREELLNYAQNLGLTGSPTNRLKQVNQIYNAGIKKLDEIVAAGQTGRPVKAITIKNQIEDAISGYIEVEGAGRQRMVNEIMKKVIPYADDVSMTPDKLAKVYKNVTKSPGSRVHQAFKKIEKGGATTTADEAWLGAYGAVSDIYKSKVKGVREVLEGLDKLHDIGSGLRQSEFMMGFKVPLTDQKAGGRYMGRAISGAGTTAEDIGESRIARGLEGIADLAINPPPSVQGTFVSGQPPSLTQAIQTGARQVGAATASPGGEMPEMPPDLTQVAGEGGQPSVWTGQGQPNVGDVSKDGLWSWNGAGWVHTEEHLQLMAVNDVVATGGKNLSTVASLSKAIGGGSENLSQSQAAGALITRYSQYLIEEGLATTPATGLPLESRLKGGMLKLQSALGLEPSGAVKAYGNAREGTMSLLAKSLGEVGTMTDQDIARARRLVPDVTMSPEEIAKNMELLMQIIEDAKAQVTAAGAGYSPQGIELTELGQGGL
jgi:hypothetical protein